jgi:hypothetical protein
VILGWHGYDNWQANLSALRVMANGRPTAMTESGINQPTVESEALVASATSANLQLVYNSGSTYFVWYQLHDGSAPDQQFGLMTLAGRWRPVEDPLKGFHP